MHTHFDVAFFIRFDSLEGIRFPAPLAVILYELARELNCDSPSCTFSLSVEGLREEEMIRSGSREQKKKTLPGGSGSGDLDDATEALVGLPTILYPDPTTTAAATTGSTCSTSRK